MYLKTSHNNLTRNITSIQEKSNYHWPALKENPGSFTKSLNIVIDDDAFLTSCTTALYNVWKKKSIIYSNLKKWQKLFIQDIIVII